MKATRFQRRTALFLCGMLTLSHADGGSLSAAAQTNPRQNAASRPKGLIGVFDQDYHDGTKPSNGQGDRHGRLPSLPAGRSAARTLVVYNDATAGTKLRVRVQPILRLSATQSRKLPATVRVVTVPNGGKVSLPLSLTVPQVAKNAGLELALSVQKQNRERFRDSIFFVAVPKGKGGTTVTYEDRDDKTRGDWPGVYGKQAFLIPITLGRSAYQIPEVILQRGSGFESAKGDNPFEDGSEVQQQMLNLENAETTDDPRIAVRGPGLKARSPAAFLAVGMPLLIRADTTDGKPHRLSLYLLDYKREGQVMEVNLYDLQGHRLDSRTVANYGEGAYLRYRFTGSVVVRLALKNPGNPTLSGVFVDAVE